MDSLARLARQHARTAQLMGADFIPSYRSRSSALGEAPILTVEPPAPEAPAPPRPVPDHRGAPSTRAREGAGVARPSRDAADVAARLADLRRRYEAAAPHARFDTQFTNIVFGEGDPCARLLFVGEAPGEDEDRTGRPFVGRAGQLLEKMILAMGLTREKVYICNVLKTRPPNNRPPTPEETLACAPYLYEQIGIVHPEVIVTLGRPASHLLLNTQDAMGRLRGQWAEFEVPVAPTGHTYSGGVQGLKFAVMPTYHPSFLLRSYTEENRKAVWSDLRQVLDRLGLVPPGSGASRGSAG